MHTLNTVEFSAIEGDMLCVAVSGLRKQFACISLLVVVFKFVDHLYEKRGELI
jgi:hypothetical protein